MHTSRTWFWVIGLTFGLGVCFAAALEINIWPFGKREQPKQDERNVQRQTQEEFRRTGEAIDELRLWAREVGIKNIDSIDDAALIRLIKFKTQKTNGDGDKPLYHNEIMRIAKMVGIPDKKVNSFETTALLSEICIALDNTPKFNKELLNDDDLRILAICLSYDKKILDIVKKYHVFLHEINGHKLIVLPASSNK